MFVFSYYQPVEGIPENVERELGELWYNSWKASGWTPLILDRSKAESHRFYEAIVALVKSRPSLNPIEYTEATFLRWLAVEVIWKDLASTPIHGGEMNHCLWCDYDVINTGWTPFDCLEAYQESTIIHPGKNPSTVFLEDIGDLRFICQMLLYNTEPAVWPQHGGRSDINDSTVFKQHWPCGNDEVTADLYGVPTWDRNRTKLWHFANAVVPQPYRTNRIAWIKQELAKQGIDFT